MSWIHWQGKRLPITRDDTAIELSIAAPDLLGPSVLCRLELLQIVPWPPGTLNPLLLGQHFFNASIDRLPLQLRHWHDLSGLVLRSTPETLARMDPFDGYGNALEHHLTFWESHSTSPEANISSLEEWASVHYELRFGTIDGYCVPCEIDAWNLLPKDQFWRATPETTAELNAFPTGPPDLRIITRVVLTGGGIEMPRCGDEAAARQAALAHLHATLGGIQVRESTVNWPKLYLQGTRQPPTEMKGWRPGVSFRTPAEAE